MKSVKRSGVESGDAGGQACHCEEAAGRRGALSAKREEVPLGCNLGKALPIYTECRRTQSLPNLTVAAVSDRHSNRLQNRFDITRLLLVVQISVFIIQHNVIKSKIGGII